MDNNELIERFPTQDDIEGWQRNRYKKNLRNKLKSNTDIADMEIDNEREN